MKSNNYKLLLPEGTFNTVLVEAWQSGNYVIDAEFAGASIGSIVFSIGESQQVEIEEACATDNCVSIEKVESNVSADIDWYNPIVVNFYCFFHLS